MLWRIVSSMFQQTIYKAVLSGNQDVEKRCSDAPNFFLFFSPRFFDARIKAIKLSWPKTAWKKRHWQRFAMRISASLQHLQHLLVWMVSLAGSLVTSHGRWCNFRKPTPCLQRRSIAAVQNGKTSVVKGKHETLWESASEHQHEPPTKHVFFDNTTLQWRILKFAKGSMQITGT